MLALAGGAAMMGRKGKGTGKGFLKSGAAGGASLADLAEPAAVTGTEYPGANKVVAPVSTGNIGNTITRTSGIKRSPSGQLIGAGGVNAAGLSRGQLAQIMQAKANAPKGVIRPGNYTPITHRDVFGGGAGFKKGGRVT